MDYTPLSYIMYITHNVKCQVPAVFLMSFIVVKSGKNLFFKVSLYY